MARMPGSIWKPLAANWNKQPRMKAYDFFVLHTMVGTLAGTESYFELSNGPGYDGTESHFGVGPDGTIWQFQDTDFQADANGDGNWHCISSENADTGGPFPKWTGSDVPALTSEQVEANARIAAWLYRTHGIPLSLAPNSKRGSRGLAVHRFGVPGYMPAGAEQWSEKRYKACPGDRRIAQAPAVSGRAQQIVAGATAPAKTPTIKQEDWSDMATKDEIKTLISDLLDEKLRPIYNTLTPGVEGVKFDGDVYGKVGATARVVTTPHDYRKHHGNPNDDIAGHVMTVLLKLDALAPQPPAQ